MLDTWFIYQKDIVIEFKSVSKERPIHTAPTDGKGFVGSVLASVGACFRQLNMLNRRLSGRRTDVL